MKGEGYKCLIIYQEIKYFYFKAKRNLSIHAIIQHIDEKIFGIGDQKVLGVTESLLAAGDRRFGVHATAGRRRTPSGLRQRKPTGLRRRTLRRWRTSTYLPK